MPSLVLALCIALFFFFFKSPKNKNKELPHTALAPLLSDVASLCWAGAWSSLGGRPGKTVLQVGLSGIEKKHGWSGTPHAEI